MSGYYPEGVTGREWQIAGGDPLSGEYEVNCRNDECEHSAADNTLLIDLDLEVYDYVAYGTWDCPACGTENDFEQVMDTGD